MIPLAHAFQMTQLVDSQVASTRAFWRRKYYDATNAEANDPRPFAEVLAERATVHKTGDGQ